jgi:diguanylate cyclase (GGDEF)-like protein
MIILKTLNSWDVVKLLKIKKGLVFVLISAFIIAFFLSSAFAAAPVPSSRHNEPPSTPPEIDSDISHGGQKPVDVKRILLLESYSKGYTYSDNIMSGITNVFGGSSYRIELQTEYMDMMETTDENYSETLRDAYKYKFKSSDFDLIISSGDAAFQFLLNYSGEVFPGIPVNFCAVNNFDASMLKGHNNFKGILKEMDPSATLDHILNLHPDTKRIYYISDDSSEGVAAENKLKAVMPDYEKKLVFIKVEGKDIFDIENKTAYLPGDGIVMLLHYSQDPIGLYMEYPEAAARISESSNRPVYGISDMYLGYGIVGGNLSSGYLQGQKVAEMALMTLQGKPIAWNYTEHPGTNELAFDYTQLERFGINPHLLPEGIKLINLPKETTQNILILNSYDKNVKWTNDMEAGIMDSLKGRLDKVSISYEYIDAMKYSDQSKLQAAYDFINKKYANIHFDLIITLDEEAYNFIKSYGMNFRDIPVVFCGINEEIGHKEHNMTGVLEYNDIKGTVDLALSLFKDTKRVIFINDTTPNGKALKKNLEEVMKGYSGRAKFIVLEDINMMELTKRVSGFSKGDIIILLSFSRDRSFNNFAYEEIISRLYEVSQVPIFGVWEYYLNNGLLGGIITRGFQQGQTAGSMAVRILDGESPDSISVVRESANQIIFDYKVMTRFGLKHKDLPEGAVTVNNPYSVKGFINEHRREFAFGLFILISVICISLLIIVLILKKYNWVKEQEQQMQRKLAMTDPLTGMPNRRAVFGELERRMTEGSEEETFTICFIDVDNMKQVNDTYGHNEGDELLKCLSNLIYKNIRSSDTAGRVGGDELMIIFHKAGLNQAVLGWNRIDESIKEFNSKKTKPYDIIVSCGFSEYKSGVGKNLQELVDEADNNMYIAKKRNKNNIQPT